MTWTRLLAPLAALALLANHVANLPAQGAVHAEPVAAQTDSVHIRHINPQVSDIIPDDLLDKVPQTEFLTPGFNIFEWFKNASATDPSLSWVSLITNNPDRLPWPRGLNTQRPNIVTIPYCFDDQQSEHKGKATFEEAIQIWKHAIGFPHQAYRHGVEFVHTQRYCLNPANPGYWNPDLPKDTLRVIVAPQANGESSATVGYRPSTPEAGGGLNNVFLGAWEYMDARRWAHLIAHELGHVLGLYHEHQRHDRDQYILFKCEKLLGYDAAVTEAIVRGKNPQNLCTDVNLAIEVGFDIFASYMKGEFQNRALTQGPFDPNSIMLYPSTTAAYNAQCDNDINECPIAKYDDPWDHGKGVVRIDTPKVVSILDAEFVRQTYPWQE